MRSTIFFVLLFIIIAAVNSGPLPSYKADELVQDGNNDLSKIAKAGKNNDVELIGPGYVELMVTSDSLFVGVDIKKCIGTVLFCYAAKSGESQTMDDAKALCRGLSNFCGFRLIGSKHDNKIKFTRDQRFEKNNLDDCLNDIKMTFGSTKYCKDISDASCNAAILAEDGRIRIHVKDTDPDNCPVSIKNAKIYVPPTTITPMPSTAAPSTTPSSNGTITKNDKKAAEASSQELTWIVLGCLIGVIILGLIGGIFLCWFNDWCMFKKKTGENLPPLHPVESIVSTTVEAKAEEQIEKEYEKIKADYPELKEVISKKSKKAQPAPPPPSAEPPKNLPPPPSAEQIKKSPPPALGKSAKKEKKATTPPPPPAAARSKKDAKKKKLAPASPGKKSVEKKAAPSKETTEKPCSSTQSYSPEFCILAVRTPSPPRQPIDPEVLRERRRRRKENGSLELYAAEREKQFKADCAAIKKRHNWM